MESTLNKDHLQAASHEAPIVKKKRKTQLKIEKGERGKSRGGKKKGNPLNHFSNHVKKEQKMNVSIDLINLFFLKLFCYESF